MIKFDQLHILNRSVPFHEYFGPMGITEEEKQKRIDFSEKFSEKMMLVFAMAEVFAYYGMYTRDWFISEVKKSYRDVLREYMEIDEYIEDHINRFAEQTEETTDDHADFATWLALRDNGEDMPVIWWTSDDRAMFIAENEANDVFNHDELVQAILDGYTYKTWHSMRDNRVRDSHKRVDGTRIPIDQYFIVNGNYGMCPCDDNLPPEETINCRCWLSYS